MKNPSSRRRSSSVHQQLLRLRDIFYPELKGRPPSSEWIGPMGFTPDQLPCIGYLRPGIIVAAGFSGYGGSYCTAAGFAAVEMVKGGEPPEWVPEDIFSPRRLLSREPFFMSQRDSLWRIAQSLCRQLNWVDSQIAEALSLRDDPPRSEPHTPSGLAPIGNGRLVPASISSQSLSCLPAFGSFGKGELERLISLMRGWSCSDGMPLFVEGEPGGSCFIVVNGAIDVMVRVRGTSQLLARLPAGSIFGEVSAITGEPRNATCVAASDTLLAELERDQCQQLLREWSPLALKFLATLNQGLISALRGADRRLMQINAQGAATLVGVSAATPL